MHYFKFRVSGGAFCKHPCSRNEFSDRFQLPPRFRPGRRGRGTEGGCGASQSVSGVAPSRAFPAKCLARRRGAFANRAKSGAKPVVEVVHQAAAKAAVLAFKAAYRLARWGGSANEDIAGVAGVAGITGKRNGSLGILAGRSGIGRGFQTGGAGNGVSSRA